MIIWLTKYRDEAVECQSIVLATVLNPRLRVKFFALHYPEHKESSNSAIEEAFNTRLQESQEQQSSPLNEDEPVSTQLDDEFDIFGVSESSNYKANSELEEYLKGKCPINKGQTPLSWWKVCLIYLFPGATVAF